MPIAASARHRFISRSLSSITTEIYNLSYPANQYEQIDFDLHDAGGAYIISLSFTPSTAPSTTYISGTHTGLSVGTTYKIRAWAKYLGTWYYITRDGTESATYVSRSTNPETPSIYVDAYDHDNIVIKRNLMNGDSDYVSYYRGTSSSPSESSYAAKIRKAADGTENALTADFTGLGTNTTYYFRARTELWDPCDGTGEWIYSGYSNQVIQATDSASNPRPSNWVWTNTIAIGQPFTNLTATDWNNFRTRINDFRAYKGLLSYNFGSNVVSGQIFTATHFNDARSAIYSMNTSVPTSVVSGANVLASSINGLKDALNNIT